MAVTFTRTIIVYLTLVVIMRLMGKRQIGEMQPYEFIVTLIIADLACIPMTDVSIPLIYGIVAILGLFLLHQVLALLEQSGKLFKRIISGKPSLVINRNGVDTLELKRNNMGVEDLIESMRSAGYFAFDELDYAIFESNGKLSALKSPNSQSAESIPLLIVNDGNVHNSNLKLVNLDKSQITNFLKSKGKTLKNTEVLTVDGKGKAYLKMKNSPFEISKFPLPEGVQW
jgi:uncharacterized membrane protein YcaP (DUF421 family)